MTKKRKMNGIVKGAMMGMSLVLCAAMFPIASIAGISNNNSVSAETPSSVTAAKSIKVSADRTNNKEIGKVTVGDKYYIPTATFGTEEIKNGAEGMSITVKRGRNEVKLENDVNGDFFQAAEAGDYVVTFTVVRDGKTYSYDYKVECKVSNVHFEFATNSEDIIPSFYDIALLKAKNMAEKDIVLPIPSVVDENGDKVELDAADIVTSLNSNKDRQVVIKVVRGTETLNIEKNEETGKYFISGKTLCAQAENGNFSQLGVHTVSYTYYENGVFVSQTTKTFDVENNYYTKSNSTDAGYTLSASLSTKPTSAVTGVEKELPTVSATAKETSHEGSVDVYYTIKVEHSTNGSSMTDVTDKCLNKDNQLLFTPFKDGNYQITYSVKDFYGNKADETTTRITIDDVKDTEDPKVFAYNADGGKQDEDEIAYRVKSKQNARNLILYAIGAKDNVSAWEKMTFTREIREGSRTKITVSDYNDKNLIFIPGKTNSLDSVYKQIVADNYYLGQDMAKDSIDSTSDDEKIATWLKEHNYLIVTNDISKNPITGDAFTFTEGASEAEKKVQLEEKGFAYVGYDYTFYQTDYRMYYTAKDEAGRETRDVFYEFSLATGDEYTDSEAPTLTFSSYLPKTCLKDDKVEFDAPVASDTDSRLQKVFAYRYLSSSKDALTSEGVTKTISFTNKAWTADNAGDKWYNKTASASSDGWIMLDEQNSNEKYEIDFAKDLAKDAFRSAQYVEIFAYAEDDYGNIGFANQVVTIAQQTENSELEIYDIDDFDVDKEWKANDVVTLPTIAYTDSFVEYMTSSVTVRYLGTKDDPKDNRVQAYDMLTERDSTIGLYIVYGGNFTASRAGDYQVVITTRDAGGNEAATFFDFSVKSNAVIEKPVIDNINSDTVNLKVGEQHFLPQPTIAISDSSDYGYYGISKEDDVNIATYYSPKMISSANSDYDLTQTHFTPNSSGEYALQYNVYLIRYNKENLSDTKENGKLYLNDNGQLKYVDNSGTEYHVRVKTPKPTEENGKAQLVVSTSILGTDSIADSLDFLELYTMVSEPQRFSVSEIGAPTINVNDDFVSNFETVNGIKRIEVPILDNANTSVDGNGSLSLKESTIEISIAGGNGTTILATINCQEPEKVKSDDIEYADGKLYLKLTRNGTYSIRYSAQAQNSVGQPVASATTKTYTVANGDTRRPEIEVNESKFLNKSKDKYSINDELILNVSKESLTFKDEGDFATSEEDLWESFRDTSNARTGIKVTNKTTNKELTRKGEGDVYNYVLDTAGEYEITITITDKANWTAEKTITIKVGSKDSGNTNVTKTIGTVLIVLSCVVLVGVVAYFIISKVKQDKKKKLR